VKAHVLVVDDERLIRTSLERVFAASGHEAEAADAALAPIPGALQKAAALPTLDEIERRYTRAVMTLTGGNKLRAAEHLRIARQTLAKRLGEA
jgi:DNA-binding NtrC family response regulator